MIIKSQQNSLESNKPDQKHDPQITITIIILVETTETKYTKGRGKMKEKNANQTC